MDKFLVRLTIVFTTIYFLYTYWMAWCGVEAFSDAYIVLFEVAVCVVMFHQGRYHCRYMRFTACGITSCDTLTRIDNAYDILSEYAAIILPIGLLLSGVAVTFIAALIHFYKVQRLKSKFNDIQRRRAEKD